jgi:protein MBA1
MKGQETITNMTIKWTSKPSVLKRAAYKPKRSLIIPTAKALHSSMATAFASGDRTTIGKICSRKLAGTMLASIDSRPRGCTYGWELVAYTNKLFYPSIRSHKLSPLSRDRYAPIVRQAVVAISSKQRRVQYDAKGQVVPGSEKEIDVIENVTMACVVDAKTWEQSEWCVIGAVKPTTYDGWLVEKAQLNQMLQKS